MPDNTLPPAINRRTMLGLAAGSIAAAAAAITVGKPAPMAVKAAGPAKATPQATRAAGSTRPWRPAISAHGPVLRAQRPWRPAISAGARLSEQA